MTKIKDIKVFDEADHCYHVRELDVDTTNDELCIYIKEPEFDLLEKISGRYDPSEIETELCNFLSLNEINIKEVHFFDDSGIILLQLGSIIASIQIAELLNINEFCVTPFYKGYVFINVSNVL